MAKNYEKSNVCLSLLFLICEEADTAQLTSDFNEKY